MAVLYIYFIINHLGYVSVFMDDTPCHVQIVRVSVQLRNIQDHYTTHHCTGVDSRVHQNSKWRYDKKFSIWLFKNPLRIGAKIHNTSALAINV